MSSKKNSASHFILAVVVLFFVSVLGGALGASLVVGDMSASSTLSSSTQTLVTDEAAIMQMVERVNPAVVSIIVSKAIAQSTGALPFYFDPFALPFDEPQSDVGEGPKVEVGGGTGFLVTADGMIVTNKHVVEDDDAEYTVVTSDGEHYDATVVARDPSNDVAIVQITATDMPTVELGDSSNLRLGQTVIAIGNTLSEYPNTVTRGIISGLSRRIVAGSSGGSAETLESVIQTDAAINPGNSGGPLLDLSGKVIGVNTAIERQQGSSVGFAISSNTVRQAFQSVQEHGRIIRPFLGVYYVVLNKQTAEVNDLPVENGAYIARGDAESAIVPYSAADDAGLVDGDIILEVAGKRVTEDEPLSMHLLRYQPGDVVELKILHNEGKGDATDYQERMVTVELDERK